MNNISRDRLKQIVRDVVVEFQTEKIPIGISNHHIHLTEEHFSYLFPNQTIEKLNDLKQPGEFATTHTVSLKGPKGQINKVRILGPLRSKSQVEISMTDARILGIKPPIRLSGYLDDAVDITIINKDRQITIPAAIIAKRHIHMNYEELERRGLKEGQLLSVAVDSDSRRTIFHDVELRLGKNYVLEMHVDTDEANAANITPGMSGRIII